MDDNKAILVVSHGSRSREAAVEFEQIVALLGARGRYSLVKHAYGELCQPDIPTAIGEIVGLGYSDIIVVPYFLFSGRHTQKDLPAVIEEQLAKHPHLSIVLGKPLGVDVLLADLLEKRVEEVLGK
jgi:sirohydrochlorin ferrochelatase